MSAAIHVWSSGYNGNTCFLSSDEQLDAAYQEVADVKTVGRGVGLWGDMVVTLKNSDKIELRSLPQFAPLISLLTSLVAESIPITQVYLLECAYIVIMICILKSWTYSIRFQRKPYVHSPES